LQPAMRNGAVAQSVEQRTENPCVAGSIPAHTTEIGSQLIKPQVIEAFLFFLVVPPVGLS
jgi:hypothetical protein